MRRAISRAQGIRELLPLVGMLSWETEAMMNRRELREDDIQRIAVPLIKIRLLLNALAPLGSRQDGIVREDPIIRSLADRFREMEGRIKEIRNDLARPGSSSVP